MATSFIYTEYEMHHFTGAYGAAVSVSSQCCHSQKYSSLFFVGCKPVRTLFKICFALCGNSCKIFCLGASAEKGASAKIIEDAELDGPLVGHSFRRTHAVITATSGLMQSLGYLRGTRATAATATGKVFAPFN